MFIRCHDSNEPISHFNIPRGQSGVAIMYSNKLSDKITKLNVGNERVIAFELELGQKYCFINTYMPTNKKDSEGHMTVLGIICPLFKRPELWF